MASARALAWLERLVWILIYAGLFAVVLGMASLRRQARIGWLLIAGGGLLVLGGVILIWVRSRLHRTE